MVPTTQLCAVRVELGAKVSKAVQELYDALADVKRVKALKQDATSVVLHVAKARESEADAVAALDKHRNEHGC
jgi:hypothetical protein